MKRILLTGAMGRIGRTVFDNCRNVYEFTLIDIMPSPISVSLPHKSVALDLSSPDRLVDLCKGMDAVVQLAGVASPDAEFSALLPANILATNNLERFTF